MTHEPQPYTTSVEAHNRAFARKNPDESNSIKQLRAQLLDEDGKIFSQPQLCEAIGLSRNSYTLISQYERGLTPPANIIAKLEKLAKSRKIKWSYQ